MANSNEQNATLLLKVTLENDVRRLRVVPEVGSALSFEATRVAVMSLFDVSPTSSEQFSWKYVDDEGDLCTLAEATFADAVVQASAQSVLRCTLTKKASQAEPSVETSMQNVDPAMSQPCDSPTIDASNREIDVHSTRAAEAETDAIEQRNTLNYVPHVLKKFAREIKDDFKDARRDMIGAFDSSNDGAPTARKVVGGAIGLVVAARLVPIRLTTLAAASIKATSTAQDTSDEGPCMATEGSDATQSAGSEAATSLIHGDASVPFIAEEQPSTSTSITSKLAQAKDAISNAHDTLRNSAEQRQPLPGTSAEMSHFTGTIRSDFCKTHDEIESAVQDIVGAGKALCGAQPSHGKCVASAFAGSLAGALVAGTLVPLRGVRLLTALVARDSRAVVSTVQLGGDEAERSLDVQLGDAEAEHSRDGEAIAPDAEAAVDVPTLAQ